MASTMEQVRDANGRHGCGGFQAGESCRIVDYVVREQNLLSPTSLEVSSGSIVHAAGERDPAKESNICTIPKSVWRRSWRGQLNRRKFRGISLLRFARGLPAG